MASSPGAVGVKRFAQGKLARGSNQQPSQKPNVLVKQTKKCIVRLISFRLYNNIFSCDLMHADSCTVYNSMKRSEVLESHHGDLPGAGEIRVALLLEPPHDRLLHGRLLLRRELGRHS